jgi:hypothetical protein
MCKSYAATWKGQPVSFTKDDCCYDKADKVSAKKTGEVKVVINGQGEANGSHVNFFDLNFTSKGAKERTLKEIKKHLAPRDGKKQKEKTTGGQIRRNLVVC